MIHLATLFDKNYAAKGLALYRSLMQSSKEDITLHVLALDDETFQALQKVPTEHMRVTALSEIEDDDRVKKVRSRPWPYFCFSMASIWTKMVIEWTSAVHECIEEDGFFFSNHWWGYIDSDCYFFGNIKIAIDELAERGKKVGIVPHRFPAHDHDRLIPNGKYNVSLILFKDTEGLEALRWWMDKCIEKCDPSTVGDQKYLDSFHNIFSMTVNIPDPVHDFISPGIGMAPWNINKYNLHDVGGMAACYDKELNSEFAVVFYHFHEFKKHGYRYELTGYPLKNADLEFIYQPYIKAYESAERELQNAGLYTN